jgi:hypothetical protein
VGYPGSREIALAVERGEVACMGLTISTFFSREPFLTWVKTGFVRILAQSGRKRDPRKDPELVAEAKKSRVEVNPRKGDELQSIAMEVMAQPPQVVEQIRKLFVQ